jgi:hypothetical protein
LERGEISTCWFKKNLTIIMTTRHSILVDAIPMSLLGIEWIQIKYPHGFHLLTSYRTKWSIENFTHWWGRYNFDKPAGIEKEEPIILCPLKFIALNNSKSCNNRQCSRRSSFGNIWHLCELQNNKQINSIQLRQHFFHFISKFRLQNGLCLFSKCPNFPPIWETFWMERILEQDAFRNTQTCLQVRV